MTHSPSPQSFAGKQILVVDDSWDNLSAIEAILESAEYKVTLAENGVQALALIQASPPDL